jgi:hypothetical protein
VVVAQRLSDDQLLHNLYFNKTLHGG